ncbi:MAG: aldo/keto reductase [Ignavibacteriales bacterium]|nr:aldo/keto reductase [Ignavibacteriales bacterium]
MLITNGQGKVKLNNGYEIPYLGLGVFKMNNGSEVLDSVKFALDSGYRHIDTAALYGNEIGVGKAIRQSGIKREEIFITSKVWNSEQGYERTLMAFEKSMEKVELDYLDLYLVHWPVKVKYKETWKALEYLYNKGKAKSIGVSNFMKHHLEDLESDANILPMINQMEFHPYLIQQDLLDYCNSKRIQYQAWSPLMQGAILSDKTLIEIAKKYGKTVAQIILRWDLQKGVVTIPKSSNKNRIIENINIFDFELTENDISHIDRLDKNQRIGADPNNFNF